MSYHIYIMKFKFKQKRHNKIVDFNSVLPDILHEFDLEKSFTIESLRAEWHEITGDIISSHSMPDRIFKGTLFIAVDHSVYANEIVMMKDLLLSNIHEKFGLCELRNIKAEVKKINW